MQMDCNSSRLSVRIAEFLDNLTRLFLWVFTALVILVVWIFSKESSVSFFFSILVVLSFVAHLIGETAEVWKAYPLWLEIGRHLNSHYRISIPLWISAAILSLAHCAHGQGSTVLVSFFLFTIVDYFISFWFRKSEDFFRLIVLSFNDEKSVHSTVSAYENKCRSGDSACFPATSEDDLLLLRTERFRNGVTETIQGEALVEFEPDSDTVFLNLPFCPAFNGIPQFDCEQISGPFVSINVSFLQTFGVRLEIKKTESTIEKEPVRISFYVIFPPLDKFE